MRYGALRVFFLVSVILPAMAAAETLADMRPYPDPEEGFTRMVFRLPALDNEEDRRVEIIVGKTLLVDCNPTHYAGGLTERVAQGWGYPYYVLEGVSGPVSTLMACPPGEERQETFVRVRGDGFLQRYNSKLPVVTYIPEGFEVRYRIWFAAEETGAAAQE